MEELRNVAGPLIVPVTTLGSWLAGVLTPLAGLVSIAWIVFQWYHSVPMKEWRERRRQEKKG